MSVPTLPLVFVALSSLVAPVWAGTKAATPTPERLEFFERKIRPLLIQHCYKCHGPEAKRAKGDLRLDSRKGIHEGGANGPALVAGEPAKSLLIKAVRYEDKQLRMPPDGKLTT